MSLPKLIPAPASETDFLDADIRGSLLALTIGDVRTALVTGFSAGEVEYMLDLPQGRVAGLTGKKSSPDPSGLDPTVRSRHGLRNGERHLQTIAQFYFNVRTDHDVVEDPEGSDLPTLNEARAEAIKNARDAMSQAILNGRDLSRTTTIEICDERGEILMRVPYTDAILPDV